MRGPSAGRSLLLGWALLVGGLPACQSGQAAGPDAVGGRPGAHTAPQTSAPPRGAASPQTASPEAASAQGTTDAGTRSDLPRARVYVKDAFGGAHRVEVEVAATPVERAESSGEESR